MTIEQKKIRNLRVLVGVLAVLFVADFIGSYAIYEEKERLKNQVEVYKSSATIWQSTAIRYKKERDEFRGANEALIEHAEPKSLNKAIKATPLPRLIEV
jgi:hypothetical protein